MTSGTEWIDHAQRLVEALSSGPAADGADTDERHTTDCRWCPVCQVAAVVRGERPEVTAALADVLTSAAAALRTVAAAGESQGPAAEAEPTGQKSQPPTVQRIDIA